MFKGTSTIELFDAASGKKLEEQTNENMATNAFKNMLENFNEKMIASGFNPTGTLDLITPFYPNYMRGLLLWDTHIPENPDIIFAPPGVRCVGHAGSAFTGATPRRGSFNAAESVVTSENGVTVSAKMVWDFPTDKGNGVIRAASLTSITGGDKGWMTPSSGVSGITTMARLNNVTRILPDIISGTVFAGELRNGIYTYISTDSAALSAGNLVIRERRYIDPNEIGIFNKVGNSWTGNATVRDFVIPTGNSLSGDIASQSVIMNDTLVYTTITSGRNVRVRYFDLVKKTLENEITFTLSETVDWFRTLLVFFKNHLYINSMQRGGLCRFNQNGQFTELISSGFESDSPSCIGEDILLLRNFVGSTVRTLMTDGVNREFTDTAYEHCTRIRPNANFKAPLFTAERGISSSEGDVVFVTPYLATINNLSAPVVKNEQNTMKVTYELRQA